MKSNFARCATLLEDKKKAIGFDPRAVGNIFSSKAANRVFSSCHNTPQTHQTVKKCFNGGSEPYVVRAARAENYNRGKRNHSSDFMLMVLGFSMMAGSTYNNPEYAM